MNIARFASYIFTASLFGFIILWGYLPRLWLMGWPQWALAASTLVGLALWIIFSLDRVTLWLKKRSTRFGIGLAVTAISAVVILGYVNWFAVQQNVKKDFTLNKVHTLSDQTVSVLKGLKEKVTLTVWSTSLERMSGNISMQKLLQNYKQNSGDKLSFEVKNPNEDVGGAQKDRITRDNIIIARSASGREARVENFNDAKGEEQITNAIIQSIKGTSKKTLCFVSGHGQYDLNNTEAEGLSVVKERLESSSYAATDINLASADAMPKDCEAVVIAGPKGDLLDREAKIIESYLNGGGKVIALFGPGTPAGWLKLSDRFGVRVRQDVIIDPRVNPPVAIATKNYAQDVDITKSFGAMVIMPQVSSISVPTKAPEGATTVSTFISSESYTYAKSGTLKNLRDIRRSGADMSGPLPVAVLIKKDIDVAAATSSSSGTPALPGKGSGTVAPAAPQNKLPTPPPAPPASSGQGSASKIIEQLWKHAGISAAHAQDDHHDHDGHDHGAPGDEAQAVDGPKKPSNEMNFIIFSNSTFIANSFVTQAGNLDLFLNTVNYVMKDQDLIGIRPRELRQASLQLSNENIKQVWATILIIAGLFALGGFLANRRRSVV